MGGKTVAPRQPAAGSAEPFAPGDVVALREIWRGRIWEARPVVVVRDEPNLRIFHLPPRAPSKSPVDADGDELRLPIADWRLADRTGSNRWNLSFAFPDTPYAVILGFDEENRLDTYYVNLQTPLVRSPVGFDMTDHVLDVVIAADRSTWSWKDEDELALAIERGLFTEEEAAWFRSWGERAVEHVLLREPPFEEDWSRWRPDPAWKHVELPPNWDAPPDAPPRPLAFAG